MMGVPRARRTRRVLREEARPVAVHPLAVVYAVPDPERTADVLVRALGFQLGERGPRGSVRLDNGAVSIRLVRSRDRPSGSLQEDEDSRERRPNERPIELEVET